MSGSWTDAKDRLHGPGAFKLDPFRDVLATLVDNESADSRNERILREQRRATQVVTTEGLRSYKAAMKDLGNADKQEVGLWANNRWKTATCPSDDESGR